MSIDLGFDPNENVGQSGVDGVLVPRHIDHPVTVRARLDAIAYRPNAYKGAHYQVKFTTIESGDENVFPVGALRVILLKLVGKQKSMSGSELRRIAAAVNSVSAEDPKVDYREMISELVTTEDLSSADLQLNIEFYPGSEDVNTGLKYCNRQYRAV
jgi:hypothetical protein